MLHLSHNSGLAIGAAIALQFVPTLLFGVWGGVLADRFDKRFILVLTAITMAAGAVLLAVLTLTGVVALWMVFAIVLLQGIAQSSTTRPGCRSCSEMTGPADLPNAIGLNSALFQVARIVGPAFARRDHRARGYRLVLRAERGSRSSPSSGRCWRWTPAAAPSTPGGPRARARSAKGCATSADTPELRSILLMTLVVGTLAINFPVVLPLIAKVTFDGNAERTAG